MFCLFIILDRPAPPQGPIEYEEVTAQSVTLSWKAPKDNGGSELTYDIKRDIKAKCMMIIILQWICH